MTRGVAISKGSSEVVSAESAIDWPDQSETVYRSLDAVPSLG
jgi:hypothetical protein